MVLSTTPTKRTARVETLVWVLIYGGLLALCLGLAVEAADFPLGWTLVTAGVVATAAGILLIFVRSRMRE